MRVHLRALVIVVASLVGAALGSLAFEQFVGRMPTVAGGQSFATGLGGFAGLAIALIVLALCRLKCLTQPAMPRYSLRALLVLVSAICLLLGYAVNWRHQRRAFLAQQAARIHGPVAKYLAKRAEPSVVSYNIPTPRNRGYNMPPPPLQPLGERGYHVVAIVVPPADVLPQQAHTSGGVPLSAYYILDSQIDYKSAIRLFPEASVWPCAYVNGQMHEVCVRSAMTGECVVAGVDYDATGVFPLHMKSEVERARLANE